MIREEGREEEVFKEVVRRRARERVRGGARFRVREGVGEAMRRVIRAVPVKDLLDRSWGGTRQGKGGKRRGLVTVE